MRLARLDLGWCGGVADGDVAALARLPALAHLQLARVQANPQLSCSCFTEQIIVALLAIG